MVDFLGGSSMPNCPVCGNREDEHREVYISSFNGQE